MSSRHSAVLAEAGGPWVDASLRQAPPQCHPILGPPGPRGPSGLFLELHVSLKTSTSGGKLSHPSGEENKMAHEYCGGSG